MHQNFEDRLYTADIILDLSNAPQPAKSIVMGFFRVLCWLRILKRIR